MSPMKWRRAHAFRHSPSLPVVSLSPVVCFRGLPVLCRVYHGQGRRVPPTRQGSSYRGLLPRDLRPHLAAMPLRA